MKATKKLTHQQLNAVFLEYLGERVTNHSELSRNPLDIDLNDIKIRVYLYNCTCPPGGRKPDEYKCQLIVPNQKRGTLGNFEYTDNRIVILAGYVPLESKGTFVLWDAYKHTNFAFSSNIQIKQNMILEALVSGIYVCERKTGEKVVVTSGHCLYDAIIQRIMIVS